jgi:hypothetical protein
MWTHSDVQGVFNILMNNRYSGSLFEKATLAQYALLLSMGVNGAQRMSDFTSLLFKHLQASVKDGKTWLRVIFPKEKSRSAASKEVFNSESMNSCQYNTIFWFELYVGWMEEAGINFAELPFFDSDLPAHTTRSAKLFPVLHNDKGQPVVKPNTKFAAGNAATADRRWPSVTTQSVNVWLIKLCITYELSPELRVHGLRGSKAYLAFMEFGNPEQVRERMGWKPGSRMAQKYARIKQFQALHAATSSLPKLKETVGFDWKNLDAY